MRFGGGFGVCSGAGGGKCSRRVIKLSLCSSLAESVLCRVMARSLDEVREELQALGVWSEFRRRREEVEKERGIKIGESTRAVMREFVEAGRAPSRLLEALSRPKGRPTKVEAAERASRRPGASGHGVLRETFAGKKCPLPTAFLWAYSNIGFPDVSPKEAPSAVAWQLYWDMRENASLKADLVKSCLGAAMRKAEATEKAETKFDGQGEYDLLARIGGVK